MITVFNVHKNLLTLREVVVSRAETGSKSIETTPTTPTITTPMPTLVAPSDEIAETKAAESNSIITACNRTSDDPIETSIIAPSASSTGNADLNDAIQNLESTANSLERTLAAAVTTTTTSVDAS